MTLRNIAAPTRHPRARRLTVAAGNVIACSTLIGFIACSEGAVTEPAAPRTTAATTRLHADLNAGTWNSPTAPNWWAPPAPVIKADTTVNTFTIDAHAGGTPYFGANKIHQILIPADAICSQNSGYGPTYWTQNCTPATGNVTFVVKSWKAPDGSPRVVFSPDLRFIPSQTVLLKLSSSTTSMRSTSSGSPVVQWCTSYMTGCVNEANWDSSLGTSFDPFAKTVWRRVKHLSGYNVIWGKNGGQ
jgi:hypothetical protein